MERARAGVVDRAPLSPDQLQQVGGLLTEACGLHGPLPAQLAPVLAQRAQACGGFATYLCRLSEAEPTEVQFVAPYLTVSESYFYREPAHFELLGQLAAERGAPLRVLCAGCAGGEEPYSAAIAWAECANGAPKRGIKIQAFDLSPAAIAAAHTATYSPWSLRVLPERLRRRYFRRRGERFELAEQIQRMVSFEAANLLAPEPSSWPASAYDLIFCRNVLMYFTPRAAARACAQLAGLLSRDGYLLLGAAESSRPLGAELKRTLQPELRGATLCYRRLPARAPDTALRRAVAAPTTAAPASAAAAPALPERAPATHPAAARALSEALLKQALESARRGDLLTVERNCRLLLATGMASAPLNYLMARCHEYLGDYERALQCDRRAIALEPNFAMPHLHMGLLALYRGESALAASSLRLALELLEREAEARLTLFADGFGRGALQALARARLNALGVNP